MNISRRQLFTNLIDTVSETIEETAKNLPISIIEKKKNSENKKWFEIGLLSDFPPNTFNSVEVNNIDYIIISNELGLYCLNKSLYENNKKEPRYLIKIENNGAIILNPFEFAPEGSVLSIMTNEFIDEKEE